MSPIPQRITKWSLAESLLIVGLALLPLILTFPYRVNIFLSWEGAYRMAAGQLPFRDFGTPLGYGFWIIPALFFKLFGPELVSLVKAQVVINIMAGFAFRSILRSMGVAPGLRFLSVLLFVLSYSFSNFWPWYNHTVIVFELVALAFLLRFMMGDDRRTGWLWMTGAALFVFLAIFTKQDAGGMTLLLSLALLAYNSVVTRRWWDVPLFLSVLLIISLIFILPLMPGFAYWYNHGQAPHQSRLAIQDFTDELLGSSHWLKGYTVLALLCLVPSLRDVSQWLQQRREVLFALLTFGILAEAALFQVTSYTPPDNNIFFHAFAFAFIVSYLCGYLNIRPDSGKTVLTGTLLVLFWWSGTFWKYTGRIMERLFPQSSVAAAGGADAENVVTRRNYMLGYDSTDVPVSQWVFSPLPGFRKVYMPASTAAGMQRILAMPLVKENRGRLQVLNMTELTPLALSVPYQPETGTDFPLWYHLGVGMFNRQLAAFTQKVRAHHYDLVLYEYAPTLNNFFPFALRTELQQQYRLADTFLAPRRPTNAIIEVYVKP